jgi:hypothetical protein
MCPQQLDHKPHNHPQPDKSPATRGWPQAITKKMLASTVQFSTNTQPPPQPPQHTHPQAQHTPTDAAIRPGSDRRQETQPAPPHQRGQHTVVFSGPNRVSTATTNRTPRAAPTTPTPPNRGAAGAAVRGRVAVVDDDSPVSPPSSTPTPHPGAAGSRSPSRPRRSLRTYSLEKYSLEKYSLERR